MAGVPAPPTINQTTLHHRHAHDQRNLKSEFKDFLEHAEYGGGDSKIPTPRGRDHREVMFDGQIVAHLPNAT